MIEVFVFGVFVAYVKLGDLVHITLDAGVYALMALTIVIIWADSALDREAVWERLIEGWDADGGAASSGGAIDPVGCEVCRLVSTPREEHAHCPRCDARFACPQAQQRRAHLGAGDRCGMLYIPANCYPVLTVMQLGAGAPSTIIGGVEELVSSRHVPACGAGVLRQHRCARC